MIPIAKPMVSEREKSLVLEVLDSGELASGRKVKEFEEKFAAYIGQPYGVAASSGTTALHMALQACGIKFGDKVLTTPFSFIATANSVLYCGAQPVFCDIDEDTFNISPESIRKAIAADKEIQALLIVHLFGLSCNMDAIMEIVKEHRLVLIEDCAQAHGSSYRGKKAGSFGKASIFSFYPTKNMTTSEGGIVVTGDEQVCQELLLLRNHGMPREYEHTVLGYNYRMTNISAAIGLGQLEQLEGFIEKRRAHAHYFDTHLKGLTGIKTPGIPSADYFHVYNQYTLKVRDDRTRLMGALKEAGIGHKIFYPTIIPDQALYRKLSLKAGECTAARKAAGEVLSIPVHPALNEADLKRIVETLGEYCTLYSKV